MLLERIDIMKTKQEIKDKIEEYEGHIAQCMIHSTDPTFFQVSLKMLLWVLDDKLYNISHRKGE